MKRKVPFVLSIAGLILVLAACVQSAPPAVTFDVLYFFDAYADATAETTYSTAFVDGIESEGHAVTTATDGADFDTKLASGNYDVAVYFNQSTVDFAIDEAAFQVFVDDGGRAILTDWSQTAAVATTFDASYTGNTNETSADLAAALSTGITDPMTLTNPSGTWGTFSMGLTAEAGGTSACTFGNGNSCLVFGNDGRTALLGFLADTLPEADAADFWANVIAEMEGS